jgi:hypothetical protein
LEKRFKEIKDRPGKLSEKVFDAGSSQLLQGPVVVKADEFGGGTGYENVDNKCCSGR